MARRKKASSGTGAAGLVALLAILYVLGSHPSAPGSQAETPGAPTPTSSAVAVIESPTPAAPLATPRPTPLPTARPTARPVAACKPTDQNRYVYHPSRLEVLDACLRASGTVAAIRVEADGDLHILLRLDPAFRSLLRPANRGELGDLVVEPVCVRTVSQSDAIAICRSDPDPYAGAFPRVGSHVWIEGRYVLDLDHGSWAELHPLYRWGPA